MRKGGGKQKGASFEREVCKALSLWVSADTQEDVYWRSAMSGGRSTVAFKKGKRLAAQSGDISCIHSIGQTFANKFYVECKAYRDLQFQGLVTGKGHLIKFWDETKKQCKQYDKLPMMVVRQNMIKPMVCLSHEGLWALNLQKHSIVWSKRHNLHIVPFSIFLAVAKLK